MLTCQFCGFDYSEEGLTDGKCPSCGSMLAWVEPTPPEPLPATPSASEGVKDDTSRTDPNARSTAARPDPRPASPEPLADESTGTSKGRKTKPTRDAKETRRVLSVEERRHLTQMWTGTHGPETRPESTIRESTPTSADTKLIVRPREIQELTSTSLDGADYELLDTIGEGGVGVVYSARQASINRTVALKMLKSGATNREERFQFLSEAVVTGYLEHPNIVPIYDLGMDHSDALFYSMKRVVGTPWSEVINEKSISENIDVLMRVADAIAFAHARGVIHRDIKPENVMIGDFGEVLVMDWGIALSSSLVLRAGDTANSSSMGGTPAYMSPEMATGPLEAIGPWSDIYLLGAVLYEAITKKTPHGGDDVMSCLYAAATNYIRPTDEKGELVDIAMRAMSTNPKSRYASVQDFQAALRSYQSHSESITLASHAHQALQTARISQDYSDFARSVFAFEEAYAMWNENTEAREGMFGARLEYAESARKKGDFDLGLSLLDEKRTDHRALATKLRAAIEERNARQQRLRSLRRVAALMIVVMLVGAISFTSVIMNRNRTIEETVSQLETSLKETKFAEQKALAEQQIAIAAKNQATQSWQDAEVARHKVDSSRKREEESAYESEIQLIERIRNEEMSRARDLLSSQVQSAKKKFRHLEWGRLSYLCHLGLTLDTDQGEVSGRGRPVEAVAYWQDPSTSQGIIVAGCSDGTVLLWTKAGDETWESAVSKAPSQITLEWSVRAIRLSEDGTLLAIGGGTDRGQLGVWRVSAADNNPVLIEAPSRYEGHQGPVTSVVFSSDNQQLLTASEDKTCRLWNRAGTVAPFVYRGHFDAVRSAQFSSDESLIVSASDDGSVRIWSVEGQGEVQRFQSNGVANAAVFSHDDQFVVSGGAGGAIRIWKSRAKQLDEQLRAESQLREVSVRQLILDRQRDLTQERLENGKTDEEQPEVIRADTTNIRDLVFSRDGDLLISVGDDHTAKVWDAAAIGLSPGTHDDSTPDMAALLRRRRDRQNDANGLLLTLRGHGSWISSASLASGGTALVTGSYDGTAKYWDLLDHQEVKVFEASGRPISSAALSLSGQWIAAALDDGTAQVWRGSGEKQTQIPPLKEGHSYMTSRGEFFQATDGVLRLITAAGDNSVRLWDVERGVQQHELTGTGQLGLLAVSADGTMFLTGSSENITVVWSTSTLQPIARLDQATIVEQRLRSAYPNASEQELRERIPQATFGCFSPDGKTVFTGDSKGGCWLWDTSKLDGTNATLIGRLAGHEESIVTGAFTADGQQLFTAGSDHFVKQWDVARQSLISRYSHPGPVTAMALSPTDTFFVTSSMTTGSLSDQPSDSNKSLSTLYRWDVGATTPSQSLDVEVEPGRSAERVKSMVLAPSNDAALVISSVGIDDYLQEWRWSSGDLRAWKGVARRGLTSSAVYSPDGSQLLTVGGRGGQLWNAMTGGRVRTYRPHGAVTSVDIAPTEDLVVTASADGTAKIWSLDDTTPVAVAKLEAGRAVNGHLAGMNSARFHPRATTSQILTASDDGTAKLWSFDRSGLADVDQDTAVCQVLQTFGGDAGHKAAVLDACFSRSGNRILTVSADGNAFVWDVNDPSAPKLVLDHGDVPVRCGLFSLNGDWIITGADDNAAWAWDARTGKLLVKFVGHSSPVTALDLSSDRMRLVTGSRDRLAKLWDTKIIWEAQHGIVSLLPKDDASGQGVEAVAGVVTVQQDLLTIPGHDAAVTASLLGDDGRMLMTASEDGSVKVWPCAQVGLPAIDLSNAPVECRTAGTISIDTNALVRAPNPVTLHDLELHIFVDNVVDTDGEPRDPTLEWVNVAPAPDSPVQLTAEREIIYDDGVQAKVVASCNAPTNRTEPLFIRFNDVATSQAIEAILHSLCFHITDLGKERGTRTVRMQLVDSQGNSGNFTEEIKTIWIIPPDTSTSEGTQVAERVQRGLP